MTSERLLLGPGPSPVSARVMRAMSEPVLSHLDPEMMAMLDDVRQRLDWTFGAGSGASSLLVSGTGTSGMEAAVANITQPGSRVRVRLLDGVRVDQLWALAASKLVPLGSQITIVGNADKFDYDTTQVVYYDDSMAQAAAKLQSGLGVGTTVKNDIPFDAADLTIIIGRDFVDKYGTGG